MEPLLKLRFIKPKTTPAIYSPTPNEDQISRNQGLSGACLGLVLGGGVVWLGVVLRSIECRFLILAG